MRLSLRDQRIRIETYILPLIEGNGYRDLRQMTGEGTTMLHLSSLSPRTLAQLSAHFGPVRRFLELGHEGALGDQIFVRCDDSPKFRALIELWMRHDFDPGDPSDEREWERLIARAAFQVPITVGVRIGAKKAFDDWLKEVGGHLRIKETALKPPYKGVSIRRFPLEDFADAFNASGTANGKRFIPVLYHASIDGFWCLSTSLDSLRDTIDRAVARREQRDKGEQTELNSSLYLAPEAMLAAAAAYQGYLEWESHRRAVANGPLWYVLRRGGVVKDFDSSEAQQAARRFFGFVPVSPDESPYRFDALRQEVRNERYGSLHRPQLRSTLPENSPLAKLLEQVRTLRVDLRFREDGVHTILTIDRHGPKK